MIARLLSVLGVVCLVIVLFTHIAEWLQIFAGMGWGLPHSPGHSLT
jgi:hypothetical protein